MFFIAITSVESHCFIISLRAVKVGYLHKQVSVLLPDTLHGGEHSSDQQNTLGHVGMIRRSCAVAGRGRRGSLNW